jgi:tRNA(Ile)-lysidine synthase
VTRGSGDGPLGEAEIAASFAGLHTASHILAAISGGPDSTALMGTLAEWCRRAGEPQVSAATVDHGLRSASQEEARAVGELARKLDVSHAILTWTGEKGPRVSQDEARGARYRLLLAHAREIGATHLVTAHTLDDQAETLLIRLAAGSGLSGLAGMRREVARGGVRHVRPFLEIPKARLVATCRERGWPFVTDPSNADPRFSRARWRHLMPALAAEGLDATRLGRLAERLARADKALDRAADAAFARTAAGSETGLRLDLRALRGEPEEIALRVLRRALGDRSLQRDGGSERTHLRLERLEECFDALMRAQAGGLAIRRTLAGCLLRLDGSGTLTISREGVRRRGRREVVTPIENRDPASLGRGPGAA